jgi:hypothetical protein
VKRQNESAVEIEDMVPIPKVSGDFSKENPGVARNRLKRRQDGLLNADLSEDSVCSGAELG